mmetsp:Transcript_57031/g.79104  ORF Transcript_57031/g.79104 Transcript_57031/m.79104 type:complete len:88 (+) Transcript_57031:116-379(+)
MRSMLKEFLKFLFIKRFANMCHEASQFAFVNSAVMVIINCTNCGPKISFSHIRALKFVNQLGKLCKVTFAVIVQKESELEIICLFLA